MRHESAAPGHAHEGSAPPNSNNPPSDRCSSFLPTSARRALGGLAVVLALAVGLLLSLSGPLQAQESSTIQYPENGEDAVATFTAVDPENKGAVVWSLKDDVTTDDDDDFEIDKADGVLTFKESPNYEMPMGGGADGTANTYTVTVVATDADGVTSEKTVTVEVTNVDEAGKVTLDAVAPYPSVPLTATHSDLDGALGGTQEWQWSRSRSESGSYTDIEDDADEAAYTPTSGDVGYYLRATVAYEDGEDEGKSAMATSAHDVQSINSPNADPAFPDQDPDTTGVQNEAATRTVGENADAGENVGDPVEGGDANGDILTYTLTGADEGSFDIDQATGQITVGADTEVNFEGDPSYTVRVTATDPAGLSAEITVTINVVDDENEPPAITGTVPGSFNEGTDAQPLTGQELKVVEFTAVDPDPDNSNTDITWSLSGEDASDFTIVGGALTFKASPNYEMPGDADKDNVYKVTVSATDADRNRGEKAVEVKVANMDEPGTVTLSAVQPRVGVALTASLTDIDGGVSSVTWQWYDGAINTNDLTQNAIENATSDTYTPTSEDEGDRLTATASYTDAQGPEKTANFAYTIEVAADTRNKAPKFAADQDDDTEGDQAEAKRTIPENSAADTPLNGGGPVIATDSNTGDILTYTLGGRDASSFNIDSSGQITVGAGTKLDYETKDTYMVTVIATDSFDVSDSVEVIITVTAVNEGPDITGIAEAEYPENGEDAVATFTAVDPENKGAVVWSLKDDVTTDDDDDFEIDKADGVLTFKESPNYEMPMGGGADGTANTYTVTVVATDADGVTSEKTVTVEVTNVDEAGKVTLDAVAPYPSVPLTATHSDLDGALGGTQEWQWSRSRSESGSYTDIEDDADEAAYTPTSGDVGYYLRATVAYEDGEDEGKSAMATSAHDVQSINSPNADPAFPDQDPDTTGVQNEAATRTVGENADAGENVGDPVEGGDANGDILTYTLTGADEGSFDIDQATGQITVGADTEVNFEGDPSYTVRVTATDPAGLSAEITVTINVVDDENEPPAITGTVPGSFNEGTDAQPLTGQELKVVEFTAVDPDPDNSNTDITWSLSGEDASDFTIVGGALTFKASPNYEMPGDADKDNVYKVTVSATDADRNRGEKAVEVKVANMDEPGTVTLSAVQPRVGVALTASLTDIDGGVSSVTWQWYDGAINTNDLTQNAIENATSDTYTPTSEDEGDRLTATASYTDAQGPEKTANFAYTIEVAADTRNKAPKFAADQDDDTEGDQAEAKRDDS